MARIYLDVPAESEDDARVFGAKLDGRLGRWYYDDAQLAPLFEEWVSPFQPKPADDMRLSDEQEHFISLAMAGSNVLVDACIGSGKTTSIQELCRRMSGKRILYLTYNKLLKEDARDKIHMDGVTVHNYHAFAYAQLARAGVTASASDLIQTLNRSHVHVPSYDVLVIDEYQDIDQEIADMLMRVRAASPHAQIIAVGDMAQKIYDKTALDVQDFIQDFLGDHEECTFTRCFRLPPEYAAMLGSAWGKTIVGANTDARVSETDDLDRVVRYLASKKPREILCLGSKSGDMTRVLNRLEKDYPDKFNKNTVYAKTRGDSTPDAESAIFTTYDGSKGMERPVCVVFDYGAKYLSSRLNFRDTNPTIIRNVFLVAASRGKRETIFVAPSRHKKGGDGPFCDHNGILVIPSIPDFIESAQKNTDTRPLDISTLFDFKLKEQVEDAYARLDVRTVTPPASAIDVRTHDGLIDLTPCIETYMRETYLDGFDIDQLLADGLARAIGDAHIPEDELGRRLDDLFDLPNSKKILQLAAFDTGQRRYVRQVEPDFVTKSQYRQMERRLVHVIPHDTAGVGHSCKLGFRIDGADRRDGHIEADGRVDVLADDTVYSLRFTQDVAHEDLLSLAAEMLALDAARGLMANIRDGSLLEVTIPDRRAFARATVVAVTKGRVRVFGRGSTYTTASGAHAL